MQGPKAARYYGISREAAGFGQGSGIQTPDEMMHYRSYETNPDGKFDTNWREVHDVLQQGVFAPGSNKAPHFFYLGGGTYYDICMKLGNDAATNRAKRQNPDSFPLASYAAA
jgi:hypothetical protein